MGSREKECPPKTKKRRISQQHDKPPQSTLNHEGEVGGLRSEDISPFGLWCFFFLNILLGEIFIKTQYSSLRHIHTHDDKIYSFPPSSGKRLLATVVFPSFYIPIHPQSTTVILLHEWTTYLLTKLLQRTFLCCKVSFVVGRVSEQLMRRDDYSEEEIAVLPTSLVRCGGRL